MTVKIQKKQTHAVQMRKYLMYLKTHTVTNSMASAELNIPQKNLCRYKATLSRNGLLWVVQIASCKLTGCEAQYLTTDPAKAPSRPKQTKLPL